VLTWNEHNLVVESVRRWTKGKCLCIAGTGSNNTSEAIDGTKHAADAGVDAVVAEGSESGGYILPTISV
jgi:4-hydroxy-tetrahydrodipicolinate synthase